MRRIAGLQWMSLAIPLACSNAGSDSNITTSAQTSAQSSEETSTSDSKVATGDETSTGEASTTQASTQSESDAASSASTQTSGTASDSTDPGDSTDSGTSSSDDSSNSDTTTPDEMEIPAGTYMMGCNKDFYPDPNCPLSQLPYHEVYLDAYAMDTFEVTVGDYTKCVEAGLCEIAPEECVGGWPSDAPVICVDWEDAVAYCEFRGKRLPTEAEWEKAARGDTNNLFPWGNEPPTCEVAMFGLKGEDGMMTPWCGTDTPQPVGSKPKDRSPYGIYDMGGSVYEWLADWYDFEYYKVSPRDNPTGPTDEMANKAAGRGIRSSSYRNSPDILVPIFNVSTIRKGQPPIKGTSTGFRCVRTLE